MAAAETAEELRAKIEATQRQVEAERARREELEAETAEAVERQKLRIELARKRRYLRFEQNRNEHEAKRRRSLDEDRILWNKVSSDGGRVRECKQSVMRASGANSTNCSQMVARGEYVWRITGFSWLKGMVEQAQADDDEDFSDAVESLQFRLGSENFVFRYNPQAGELGGGYHGSLGIVPTTRDRIMLRYRIYVKARSGAFLQWGETRDVVNHVEKYQFAAYGPDVHWPGHPPESLGIFGLSYDELLQSEWVENDTLTVKFELEVRPNRWAESVFLSQL